MEKAKVMSFSSEKKNKITILGEKNRIYASDRKACKLNKNFNLFNKIDRILYKSLIKNQ